MKLPHLRKSWRKSDEAEDVDCYVTAIVNQGCGCFCYGVACWFKEQEEEHADGDEGEDEEADEEPGVGLVALQRPPRLALGVLGDVIADDVISCRDGSVDIDVHTAEDGYGKEAVFYDAREEEGRGLCGQTLLLVAVQWGHLLK